MWADPKDVKLLEKKIIMSGIERDEWWRPDTGQHEVTFALSLITSQPTVTIYTGPPGYGAEAWKAGHPLEQYLTGTIDWQDWGDGKTIAYTDDLKTGHWPVYPNSSKQLRSYALVPWVVSGCPSTWDGWVSITTWEKYPLASLPRRAQHLLNAMDLDEHLDALKFAATHPDEINPSDEGCMFCDCRPLCPSWVDAATALGNSDELN